MTKHTDPTTGDPHAQTAQVALEISRLFQRMTNEQHPVVLMMEELAILAIGDERGLADHSFVKDHSGACTPFEVARCRAMGDAIATALIYLNETRVRINDDPRRDVMLTLIGVLHSLDRAVWAACYSATTGEATTFPAFNVLGAMRGIGEAREASKPAANRKAVI